MKCVTLNTWYHSLLPWCGIWDQSKGAHYDPECTCLDLNQTLLGSCKLQRNFLRSWTVDFASLRLIATKMQRCSDRIDGFLFYQCGTSSIPRLKKDLWWLVVRIWRPLPGVQLHPRRHLHLHLASVPWDSLRLDMAHLSCGAVAHVIVIVPMCIPSCAQLAVLYSQWFPWSHFSDCRCLLSTLHCGSWTSALSYIGRNKYFCCCYAAFSVVNSPLMLLSASRECAEGYYAIATQVPVMISYQLWDKVVSPYIFTPREGVGALRMPARIRFTLVAHETQIWSVIKWVDA